MKVDTYGSGGKTGAQRVLPAKLFDGTVNEDTDCSNPNSLCQGTGAIGDAATFGACIPDSTFAVASDCPSGTHAVDAGDGKYHCLPPSGIECNGMDFADGAFDFNMPDGAGGSVDVGDHHRSGFTPLSSNPT